MLLPIALSIASGLLLAVAFPQGPPLWPWQTDGWWPAGWLCLVPLMLAAARARRARHAAGLGLLAGAVAYAAILCWIDPFLIQWARLSRLEAAGVSGLLILYVASYPGLFAACLCLWSRRFGPVRAYLLAPACWTALELARGNLMTGFPWCLLGYSQMPVRAAIQVADLAGIYGVSFLLASCSAAVACLFETFRGGAGARRGAPTATVAAAALAAVVLAGLGYGAWRLAREPAVSLDLPVALVQANVAQTDKWDPRETTRIEEDHIRMTREAAASGARLVVWSESSVPISITHHPDYERRLEALADATQVDLLAGTVTYERTGGTERPLNSAVLVRPGAGVVGRYDKLHLVPFGEYVPLARLLFFVAPLVAEAGDFLPGRDIALLRGSGPSLGPLICYEAIFPDITRRHVRAGAQMLVNITNDAWYGDTAMPRQHLMQAALRAVESRRWLLRCANTGISAVVDPSGRIVARSRFNTPEVLAARVAPASAAAGATIYAAAGDVFAIGCAILATAALVAALLSRPARDASDAF